MTTTRKLTNGTGFVAELTMYEDYATVYWKGSDGIVYGGGKITKEKYHELIAERIADGWYFDN